VPAPYCYDYPRPALTVDLVALAREDGTVRVLLIRRKHDPFAGRWALPGGFVEIDEPVAEAVRREFREETGLEVAAGDRVVLLGVWSKPRRDPRGRTISLVHVVKMSGRPPQPHGADDASEAAWHDPATVTGLAFDHDEVLAAALSWLESGTRPDVTE
jgi:8-oxo-dGTP diphosphatase